MTVSDPLLRQLKGIVLKLRTENKVINDASDMLPKLCRVLEDIFRKGLKNPGWFGKCDYWTWISKLTNISKKRSNPILSMVIDSVKDSKKVCTSCGRGRLFVRSALVKKVLAVPVQMLARDQQLAQEWYTNNSILGDEILTEILQSLLFELTEVPFHLLIKNASFLDTTWDLPKYQRHELVPCDNLGVHIQIVRGYVVVVSVETGSVVEEDGKVTAGDVIDELYKQPLRGMKLSSVQNLLQKYQGLPVLMNVVKYQLPDAEENTYGYQPIADLLREIDIDPVSLTRNSDWQDTKEDNSTKKPAHAILQEEEDSEIPVQGSGGGAVYEGVYLGYAELGADGRVQRIEDGVGTVVKNSTQKINVRIDLTEKDILITDKENQKTILQHPYTAVSACGRRTDAMTYIAYIAGETTCSLAKKFLCHVLELKSSEEARLALCTMAQGFQRTQLLL